MKSSRSNRKGQFSIIAALLVAVVLIAAVMTTYSAIRYGQLQKEPQVLSAIDEINLALKRVLGFTVGYYGSVLQVTGNTSYAKMLASNYLRSGLENIGNIRPEWSPSFNVTALDLSTNWFTNTSYSSGRLSVKYDLVGIGFRGMSYSASSRLDVQVLKAPSSSQAWLSISKDESEPLINLGKQNLKFYRYIYSDSTWELISPSSEPTVFANGTYIIDLPSGLDSSSYIIKIEDSRGIMVIASSFSRYTATLAWNTPSVEQGFYYVDNISDVDGSPDKGTHSNFTAQQYGPDGIYDTLTEAASGTIPQNYYPNSYILNGLTTHVSGSLTDLQSDDSVRMVFRSYASGTSTQTLYAHQETTLIGGLSYRLFKLESADGLATTLSASMGTSGRQLFGKFVYPLTGVTSIPANIWTVNYRAWHDIATVAFDSSSSVEAATPAASVSWSHTTGTASNRLLIVSVSVHAATGTPTSVTGVTYGGIPLTQVTTALYSATNPQVRTYIFRLLNPDSGTRTITVNFAAATLYVCGATTYANVDQSTPIQNSATTTGSSTSPSVPVTVTGTGRAVFGHLGGHRTPSQVTFQAAGTGSGTTGNPTPSYPSGLQAGDLILLQVTVRDTSNIPTAPIGFTLLYGPDTTGTTGRQWIYYRFATGSESGTITITIGGSSCKMARMYSFRNVASSSFTEGGGFGSGTGRYISAQSVTTTDVNRLAVSFVFVCNDNSVGSFTGETGGDWTEAVAEYTTTAGSDGCVQLQTATMASAGTISGGSYDMGSWISDAWGVRAFALKPRDWAVTEGSGQNSRWIRETYLYKGRGSDRLNVTVGTVTMSWSTDFAPNWVCSAVVINPNVPVGHCDIDVVIRMSNGTIRSVIATNVANSNALTSTATTLSGTYSWGAYTVVDQTDYLEIAYYVDVTTASSVNAFLRIDDSSLALSNQTRIDGIMLPSEYTSEVELIGASDTLSWTRLAWITDSSCTAEGVNVTVQLWNYQTGRYAQSGEDGYNSTITVGTSDVAMAQTITANPTAFRNSTGDWKLKFKAVKSTSTQFDMNLDLIRFSPEVPNYALDLEEQWINVNYINPRQDLCIKTGTLGSENLMVDVRSNSSWITVINSLQPNTWNNVSVTPYINSPTLTIRFRGSNDVSDPVQDSWNIDAVLLKPQPDIGFLSSLQDSTVVVELLQNGTMRWLGQNLQLTTQTLPIPPIPVKAIHANQTINGVNQEVPFQIEDWASEYRIPLGLTSNATVFSNRQMIVFLVNINVSKITIWWNGSDDAVQTPLAYTNFYFSDNPSNRILNNGRQRLQLSSSGFTIRSTVGSTNSTADLMRINNRYDTTDPEWAYVIVNGPVRSIIQGEAEWSGGISDCPNVYSNIVITLPANATYYTYQLRLMFINSMQLRTITDLCPIRLSTNLGSIQTMTENGTASGFPIVANGTGTFYNYTSSGWTAHHWSQIITGTRGAGIMFTDTANQRLYAFDSVAPAPGTPTGALSANNTTNGLIQLLPVTLRQVQFTYALDITWHGAVVTFDNTTPIYKEESGSKTGLWITVEYPPQIAVTTEG